MSEFSVLSCTGKDAARWQSLIDRLPYENRDIMLTPAYARVQQALDQGECFAAIYEWEGHFILQPFVRRGQGLGSFYGGGGPVYNHLGWVVAPGPQLWLWFEQAFAEWRKQNKISKEYVRLHPTMSGHQKSLLREAPIKLEPVREAVTVNIDLDDDALLHSFSRNRIRGVKDAIEAKVQVSPALSTAAFAEMYKKSLERLGATEDWFYPQKVWDAYWTELGDEHLTVLMASAGDGHLWPQLMVLHGYGRAYAHFLASDPLAAPGITDKLYYESMKYCRDVGCKTYFLGGGTTSEPADSLLAYKSGYSRARVPVYCYRREFAHADCPQALQA